MDAEILSRLVDAKLELLGRLRDLSQRQLQVVNDADLTVLTSLLSGKQTLLQQLSRVDQALEPCRTQDPETRKWASPAKRKRCQDQIQRCEAVLREILVLEKDAENAMVQRRDEAAYRLQDVQGADAARSAYARPSAPTAGLLDLQTEG